MVSQRMPKNATTFLATDRMVTSRVTMMEDRRGNGNTTLLALLYSIAKVLVANRSLDGLRLKQVPCLRACPESGFIQFSLLRQ